MSIYTTPLQFGYFFSLLIWLLMLVRGYRERRLSDIMLGWIMFILAMELQDYTFGFAGINILWNELNGFPRSVSLLFGPAVYFYFLSQTNRNFQLKKKHLWHVLPFSIYFSYKIIFFVQGQNVVEELHASLLDSILSDILRIVLIISFIYYLTRCLIIYKRYQRWSMEQYSNLELIDFKWFRNFIYCMIFWLMFRELMFVLDAIFDLDFYQDWWWNLALVGVVFYIGLTGYAQKQYPQINFSADTEFKNSQISNHQSGGKSAKTSQDLEKTELASKIIFLMENERLFLQPELSLNELAQHLHTNSVQLSATINQMFNKNFNDYINGLRIEEFIKKYEEDVNRRYTLLSLAFDSGFNSKATFNRAFKKIKGSSPIEYLKKHHG